MTEWGYEVEPIIRSLGRWAARSPVHDPTLPISATSIMLSFRTMFDADRAASLPASASVSAARPSQARSRTDASTLPAATRPARMSSTGTATALAAAVYGGHSLDTLAKAGSLSIDGDRAVAERFTTLFPLPPKVKKTR